MHPPSPSLSPSPHCCPAAGQGGVHVCAGAVGHVCQGWGTCVLGMGHVYAGAGARVCRGWGMCVLDMGHVCAGAGARVCAALPFKGSVLCCVMVGVCPGPKPRRCPGAREGDPPLSHSDSPARCSHLQAGPPWNPHGTSLWCSRGSRCGSGEPPPSAAKSIPGSAGGWASGEGTWRSPCARTSVVQVLLLPGGRGDGAVRVHDDLGAANDHHHEEEAEEDEAGQGQPFVHIHVDRLRRGVLHVGAAAAGSSSSGLTGTIFHPCGRSGHHDVRAPGGLAVRVGRCRRRGSGWAPRGRERSPRAQAPAAVHWAWRPRVHPRCGRCQELLPR